MDYETLLANAPPQDSDDFIDYLRTWNTVDWENNEWIVIENFKYSTPTRPWFTAFAKLPLGHCDVGYLNKLYGHMKWVKNAPAKQTVPGRFHIHMYEN